MLRHTFEFAGILLLGNNYCILFSSGAIIRSIWPEPSPGDKTWLQPSKSWMKYLDKCPDLERLRFDWAVPGSSEDASGLFSLRRLRKLQIDNFDVDLLKMLSSKFQICPYFFPYKA